MVQGTPLKIYSIKNDFLEIKKGIQNTILQIVNNELLTNFKSFQLEKYHHFVTDRSSHIKVVSKTLDLFSPNFVFNINDAVNLNL